MQLIAGRTGQEYNKRKKRKGAFWEDRYRTTVVESGSHLAQCMVYIDLNMVRAGVVTHPSGWPYAGYNEIMIAIDRYFSERNQYFIENPKTAGNKIWGKETTKATFSESNNCKDPRYMN
jgi:hypothetical protein